MLPPGRPSAPQPPRRRRDAAPPRPAGPPGPHPPQKPADQALGTALAVGQGPPRACSRGHGPQLAVLHVIIGNTVGAGAPTTGSPDGAPAALNALRSPDFRIHTANGDSHLRYAV